MQVGTEHPMPIILFAGGGTLGHIIPAVAVVRALEERHPNVTVHFLCSPRGESAFLKKEGIPYTIVDAPRMGWNLPWKFWKAYAKAKRLLHAQNPVVVFSKGGYVSVPICLAARHLQIPIVLHESDSVVGRANSLLAHWADIVCMGFPMSGKRPSPTAAWRATAHSQFTGNPVRSAIMQGSYEEGLRLTGFSGDRPVLLVMGGSQGAQSLNEWVTANLTTLISLCDIIHLTGPGKRKSAGGQQPTDDKQTSRRAHYFALSFAHEILPHLYALTDLAVSRAGAGSIAELAANGIPTILIPLAGVAHDHQKRNAGLLSERGSAVVVTQNTLDKELLNVVRQLIGDVEARKRLGQSIRTLQKQDSAGQIAEILSGYLAP
jgi:UDP-N-acetylglucosamine--N-acetylmuramyl-(pentapeptide) pyrophosphoryl-undecaprenol N-acetylglucosamine transferase